MDDIIGNILGVILIPVVLLLIVLIFQFLSKISGKGIRRRGSRSVRINPNDFDNTIDALKESASTVKTKMEKLRLDDYNRIIYDIDKTISKTMSLRFSSYLTIVAKMEEQAKREQSYLAPRLSYVEGRALYLTYQDLHQHIQGLDLSSIIKFFQTHLNDLSNEGYLLTFFDCICLENFRPLVKVIDKVNKEYWRNRLTDAEVNKIKRYLLTEYFQVTDML